MTDLLLIRTALRDAIRPARLIASVLLIALPSLIALIMKGLIPADEWDPGKNYDTLTVLIIFGFILTILSVVNGTGVVSQEIEQRTVVYLLMRPVARWRILIAKSLVSFASVAVTCIAAVVLLALVIFGPSHIGLAGIGPDIRSIIMGSIAYGSLFVLLGTLVSRPLLFALLYVFSWEGIAPRLPGSFAKMAVMTYLRVLAKREVNDAAQASQANNSNPVNAVLSFTQPANIVISTTQAWATLIALSVIAMAFAIYSFSVREYTPREGVD